MAEIMYSNHYAVLTCCCWDIGDGYASVAVVALDLLEVGVAEAALFLEAKKHP